MKIKAKEKDGIVKVKLQIKHPMLTYNQAKTKGVDAKFVTHITGEVGGAVVYELSSSQFLSKNPLIKFKFHGKKGDVLNITWKDSTGESITESKKIK